MTPSDSCSRALLNQPTDSTTASSSCDPDRQTRSAISSVLKLSTNDSASALSEASPTEPTEPTGARGSRLAVRQGLPRRFAPTIPVAFHQPLYAAARHRLAGTSQRLAHPAVA